MFKRVYKMCDKPRYFWTFGMIQKLVNGWITLTDSFGEVVYVRNLNTNQWYGVHRIIHRER